MITSSLLPHLEMQASLIDKLPPEMIAQILTAVINTHSGDPDIRRKWRLPFLFMRISRQFYHITSTTHSLWKYLYIRRPIHPCLRNYIAHSGSLPLSADVLCDVGSDEDEPQSWKQVFDVLVPLIPRLESLIFHSPSTNDPIFQLLKYEMPLVESLKVNGMPMPLNSNLLVVPDVPISHLVSLRLLELVNFPCCVNASYLPEALEELYLDPGGCGFGFYSGDFWHSLPSTLRILRITNSYWAGVEPPHHKALHLPSLTELQLCETIDIRELSILHFLVAPSLKRLKVDFTYEADPMPEDMNWCLDFPALTHLTCRFLPQVLRLDHFLRKCSNLTTVHLKGMERSELTLGFVPALVDDPALLPHLEDLMIRGTSILILKRAVLARPNLKFLRVCEADLYINGSMSAEDPAEWEECKNWLESHVIFDVKKTKGRWVNNLVMS